MPDSENYNENYKAKRNTETKIGFFGAMLGLAIQPWETTQLLLSKEKPKFIFTFLFILLLVIFGPTVYFLGKYGMDSYQPNKAFSYFCIFVIFVLLYILFESLYLFVLGIEFTFSHIFAIVVYSLTPLISLFLIIYTFHYLGSKNFNFMYMIAQGNFVMPAAYAKIIPYMIIVVELSILFILAFSIKTLTEAQTLSALIYAVLSIVPITMAAFSTAFIAEIISPGSKELVFQIINTVIAVWGY